MQFYAKHGHYALPSKSSTYNGFAVHQVSHKSVRDFCKHKPSKNKTKQNNLISVSKNLNFKFS